MGFASRRFPPENELGQGSGTLQFVCVAGNRTCIMRMLLVLLPVLLSTKVSVAEVPLQAGIDRIECGTSEFAVTSICNVTGPVRCERQSMTMTALHNWSLSEGVPLAGETDHTLATTLHGWACVTSPSGVKYLVLEYICDDRSRTCTDELQQQEFTQVVDLSGHNLDQGHSLVSLAHDAVMRQTGIDKLLSSAGLRMQSLSFGRKAINRSIRPN